MTSAVELVQRAVARTSFTRAAIAYALAKGSRSDAAEIAGTRWPGESYLPTMIQRDIPSAATNAPEWAGAISGYPGSSDFVALLRPRTVIGQLALRPVPFLIPVARTLYGGGSGWVGEGQLIQIDAQAFDTAPGLPPTELASITIQTVELLNSTLPSAENAVQENMLGAATRALNLAFLDPESTGTPDLQPASITAAAQSFNSSGNPLRDIATLIAALSDGDQNISDLAFIMSPTTALAVAVGIDGGTRTLGIRGGTLFDAPVIVAPEARDTIVGLRQSQIVLADAGVAMDMSAHATVDVRDDVSAVGPAVQRSLWQRNERGIRVLHRVNWQAVQETAVALIRDVQYPGLATGLSS